MRSTAVSNRSIQSHVDSRRPIERTYCALTALFGSLALGACEAGVNSTSALPALTLTDAAPAAAKPEESHMWMTVGDRRFAITLRFPLTLDMSDLNGNEKHAELPRALPTDESRPGTIRNGDLMLYGTDTLVVFYLTFKSSYSYTRLGRVDDPDDLAELLGRGTVGIGFSKK